MKKKQKNIVHKTRTRISSAHKRVIKHGKNQATSAKRVYRRGSVIHKIGIWLIVICLVLTTAMFGVAQWYINKHKHEPLTIGATFIPYYAEHLGLNPHETLRASIDELGLRRFRLVSYWDKGEPQKDVYDFNALDWQFDMIEKAGGEVTLAIGARQPRWPECHIPRWALQEPGEAWKEELKEYMGAVIDRYKDRSSLVSYQLENEYFLEVFGECEDHTRERLVDQFNFVKSLDPNRPVIVSRSNNAVPSWPVNEPRADIVGASIYKRVWDRTITKRYFEYPFPAWFYGFLAGATELTTGRNTFIHEMQAEPWPPKDITEVSLEEQDKSFNASMMKDRLNYAVGTGMRTIDLWGVEWWYYRKVKFNDFSVWEAGKREIENLRKLENQCPGPYNKPDGTSC